jgi:NAD(P)-dependent dehydrogenase (short-subunit alcohol dehydrogenase family)
MERFAGKVAVVTGGGAGIGEGYAKAFAREGANVVIADINTDGAQQVSDEINAAAGGKAVAVTTDVSDEQATLDLAATAIEHFGGVDVLINNAGLYRGMEHHTLLNIPISYWNKFFDISLTGALLCSRAVVSSMTERGGGSIINQSSTGAWMGAGAYGTAKLAVHSLTHSLARELGPLGIRVNAIAPGPTDTAATRELPGDIVNQLLATMPIARLGTVDDHAEAALFLSSDAASWITGVILNVDGGQLMRA